MIKYKYSKLYWLLKELEWLKVYFSPFKPPIPKLYIGRIAIGVPYFFPIVRKKATPKKAYDATIKEIEDTKKYNEKEQTYKRTVRTFDEIYAQKINSSFAQPKKIGFNFVSLGWKTKWERDDYRFEWSPVWSFVFFKWQIAVTFVAPEMQHFWECWLYYNRETKHTAKTTKGRLTIARKKFPCKWTTHKNGVEEKICYWDIILKNKWKNN